MVRCVSRRALARRDTHGWRWSDLSRNPVEQALAVSAHEVCLGADRTRRGPEGHELGERRHRGEEALTPSVVARLDVAPEVALAALRAVHHGLGLVVEDVRCADGLVDEVADRVEHAAVALVLGGLDRATGRLRVGQHLQADQELDERRGVADDREIERLVLRVGQRVEHLGDERPDDRQLVDHAPEARGGDPQVGAAGAERGVAGEHHHVLDLRVAFPERHQRVAEGLCRRDGQREADVAGRLVVDPTHGNHFLLSWNSPSPFLV